MCNVERTKQGTSTKPSHPYSSSGISWVSAKMNPNKMEKYTNWKLMNIKLSTKTKIIMKTWGGAIKNLGPLLKVDT
jgi:hypothetical protein